jgi:hypothetical protein
VIGELAGWLAQHAAIAVLLRPDFYVYGIARQADDVGRMIEDLDAALSR